MIEPGPVSGEVTMLHLHHRGGRWSFGFDVMLGDGSTVRQLHGRLLQITFIERGSDAASKSIKHLNIIFAIVLPPSILVSLQSKK